MDCLTARVLIVSTLTLFLRGSNGDMAKLCSSGVPLTSSTLAWNSFRLGDELPQNTVPIGSGGPAWCRTREHAIWLSGAVVDGQCRVPFLRSVLTTKDFEVLVSVNGSARLVEVPWDSLVAYPRGVVCTEDMMLALGRDVEGGVVRPGFVSPNERRAHLLDGGDSAIKSKEAFLVTEKEPVSYKLSNVRLGETNEKLHDDVLEELELRNDLDEGAPVSRDVTFVAQRVVYFGKMKGTVVGLPTSVSGPDIFPANITWGTSNERSKNRTVTVKYDLPARSSVVFRLVASIRNLEGGYSGVLSSEYDDGVVLQRNVEGLHTERTVAEVRAEFEEPTSLDGEVNPVTGLPKVMVLLHSTTTTPAPLYDENASSESSSHNQVLPQPQGVGINGAVSLAISWMVSLNTLLLRQL